VEALQVEYDSEKQAKLSNFLLSRVRELKGPMSNAVVDAIDRNNAILVSFEAHVSCTIFVSFLSPG